MARALLVCRMGCCLVAAWWLGCSPVAPGGNGNDNRPFDRDADPAVVAEVEPLLQTIEEYGEQFDALLLTTDVAAAAEQVAAALAAEPEVEWAVGDAQGVALLFRNGMQAALLEDLQDEEPGIAEPPEELDELDLAQAKGVKDASAATMVRLPGAKKTIFLNPHNWERQAYATKIVQKGNARFDEVGMDRFVVYLGEQCTLDRLSELGAYGVVHFYSHGAPFPRRNNIQEVYLMTGEIADAVTTAVLKDFGLWGSVLQGRTKFKRAGDAEPAKHVMYFVSPRYLTEFNNFANARPLIYLGFCYSWRGSWQATLTRAGASDAVGFDWAVKTNWNAWWGRTLYHKLGDKSLDEPMTINGWYELLRARDRRSYVYTDDNKTPDDPLDDVQRTVTVYYDGAPDFTLWEREPVEEPSACAIYEPWDRWLLQYDYDCNGDVDSESLWHFHRDGTISDHWLGVISGYSWEINGDRITIRFGWDDMWYEANISDDCRRMIDAVTIFTDGRDNTGQNCWSASKG